jgi:SAM-dependent methyltransferase
MSLRFHEIAETYHRILNPFTHEKLALLADICQPNQDTRILDLACGKGELLNQWAKTYGIHGTGVDISEVFLSMAHNRAAELNVTEQLEFVQMDAAQYQAEAQAFNIVSCIGASWIGGGLIGTLKLMLPALKPQDGFLLMGEPFWYEMPPEEAYEALGIEKDDYSSLEGTLDRFESLDLTLVEMVLAIHDDWDRYEAPQWLAIDEHLRQHPDDPDAEALQAWLQKNRRAYLAYGRRYFGWGAFVLRN